MSIRGALWDLRIPRTNPVSFRARDSDRMQKGGDAFASAVKTRHQTAGGKTGAGDFELPDYWDDGEPLAERESLPVILGSFRRYTSLTQPPQKNSAFRAAFRSSFRVQIRKSGLRKRLYY
ncbi:hypothetical protein FRC06_001911 [Ceratobasidium sp. 370]|nr:hypothetical protein FRC06_001911 [Ceratobasidium sp. 370]